MKWLKCIVVFATLSLASCGKVETPKTIVAPATTDENPGRALILSAKSDEEIETFVRSHKHEKITSLDLTIDWAKCSARGFLQLAELTKLEQIVLNGDDSERPLEGKSGDFYFKPIAAPDSFAEQISEIKSLKRIEVWYGCLPETQKQIIKKKLPACEITEHMNKI